MNHERDSSDSLRTRDAVTEPSLGAHRRRAARKQVMPVVVGIAVALIALVGGAAVLYGSYNESRTAVVAGLAESHLALARQLVQDEGIALPRRDLSLRGIDARWHALAPELPGRFVTVINRSGKIVYHSANPEMIGRDASDVRLGAGAPSGITTLGRLVADRSDWAGENVGLSGLRQVAAYAYSGNVGGLVAVHIPAEYVDERVRATAFPWIVGLGLVILVLIPISAALFIWGFRRVQLSLKAALAEQLALENELEHARKMEAVGRLAGGLAHDFNNFMTAVLGYADAAAEKASGQGPVMREIEEIKRTVMRAADLTGQLLAIGRRQPLRAEPFDVNVLVSETSRIIRRIIGDDVELVLVLSAQPGWTMADAGQIEQVLINLAVNARDAMPQGGRLTAETSSVELTDDDAECRDGVTTGRYVRLVVSDDGTGMDEKTRRRAFEPYFTTKSRGLGSGFGLSSAYGIVKQSGGAISIDSEQGRGTEITILLREIERPASRLLGDADGLAAYGSAILVAENDDAVRDLIRRVLEQRGHSIIEARDGRTADDILERRTSRVDLVITDLNMPGVDGASLARRVAELRPGTPVLFISGSTAGAPARTATHPRSAFLNKPFKPAELTRAVREILDSTAAAPPVASRATEDASRRAARQVSP